MNTASLENPLLPPSKAKSYRKFFGGSIVFVLIIGILVATPLAIAYMPQTFSFIPLDLRLKLNSFLDNFPLPKTIDQVLIKMVDNMDQTAITTYNQKLFLEGSTNQPPMQFGLRLDGQLDLTNSQLPAFNQQISLMLSDSLSDPIQAQLELTSLEGKIYAKVNSLPEDYFALIGFPVDVNTLIDQWYSFDLAPYIDSLSSATTTDSSLSPEIDPVAIEDNFISDFLPAHDFHQYLTLAGEEQINNMATYRIQMKKTGSEVAQLITDFYRFIANQYPSLDTNLTEEDLQEYQADFNYVQTIDANIWIDKIRFIPVRITANIQADLPNSMIPTTYEDMSILENIATTTSLNLNLGWEISQLNEPSAIIAPTISTPFEDIFSQIMLDSITQSQDSMTKSDLSQLKVAIEMYVLEYGRYPSSLEELVATDYLLTAPISVLGTPYDYFTNGDDYIAYAPLLTNSTNNPSYYIVTSLSNVLQTEMNFTTLQSTVSLITNQPITDVFSNEQVYGQLHLNAVNYLTSFVDHINQN